MKREELEALLDQGFEDQVRRWERPMVRELPPVVTTVRSEMPLRLVPEDWGMGIIRIEEQFIGGQLVNDLRSCVPQALLRDLFRPRIEVQKVFVPRDDTGIDQGGVRGYAEAREAQRIPPPVRVELSLTAVALAKEERRAWLQGTWKPHYRDDEEHPRPRVPLWTD